MILVWCTKPIHIRTFPCFRQPGTFQFIKGNGLCSILEIEGQHQFIIIEEDGVDKYMYALTTDTSPQPLHPIV